MCVISRGFRPKPWHKKLFGKSFLELQKLSPKLSGVLREILLPTFLIRKVGEGGLERSSNTLRKNKKRGIAAFFVNIKCWGYPPQTLTQETFREKFLGTSKAFAKVKWCISVGNSFAYFSYKKSTVAHLSPKERCVRIFKGLFSKSLLKQGPLMQFQLFTIK